MNDKHFHGLIISYSLYFLNRCEQYSAKTHFASTALEDVAVSKQVFTIFD